MARSGAPSAISAPVMSSTRSAASAGSSAGDSRRAAGGSRSASGTRWLAISLSGVLSTWPPADGRNLTPTMTVPGSIIGRAGPVSGPAT